MNTFSIQGYIDSAPLDVPVTQAKIGGGYRRHRIYAALDCTDAGDWCEAEVVLTFANTTTARLPLKVFQPAAQGYQPNDSAFAASTVPPAAPNVMTVRLNYTGTTLYLFPFYSTEEIIAVSLVPKAYNFAAAGLCNYYLGIISEQ